MLYHLLRSSAPAVKHAIGAAQGEEMLRPLLHSLTSRAEDLAAHSGELVILDFTGIEAATASFIKATVVRLLKLSQQAADEAPADEKAAEGPLLNIYPCVHGLATEVREELSEVLVSQRLVCLEAMAWNPTQATAATLYGPLEVSLWNTLQKLTGTVGSTASQLHANHPEENINVTAWNNRLADLFRLRLVRRVRQGRPWLYSSIAGEVRRG
ncbi:MAG: hypothetical protein U1A78_15960 [Polyangia bacterium]